MENEIAKLMDKVYSTRRLFYASLELTYKCNFACKFCYNPVERENQVRTKKIVESKNNPLTKEEIFSLLEDLRELGVLYFTLTGGEPLVHPNFWEIAKRCKELSFVFRIFTNGSLIGEKEAKLLAEICPNCIEISLYGASEESYQLTCQRGSSFNKVMNALKLLKNEGLTVYLKCLLTKVTEKEMDKIQDIADGLGFPLNWDPEIVKSDDGEKYPLNMKASNEGIERLFNDKRFRVGSSQFEGREKITACNIGRNLIHIDPYGYVFPCLEWRESIGNIREANIKDMWEKSEKLRQLMKSAEIAAAKSEGKCFVCIARMRKNTEKGFWE